MLFEYTFILIGSLLYAISTVCFIFPSGLLLGGTSGISVILTEFLGSTPGTILTVINIVLLLLALVLLGKSMALKTLVGSLLTTLFISLFEGILKIEAPIIDIKIVSALIGAAIIALASALMLYVDSSSGGTDIIALIIKKFSGINIGGALFISDILIVIIGGILSGLTVFVASLAGFLVKVFGVDAIINIMKKVRKK